MNIQNTEKLKMIPDEDLFEMLRAQYHAVEYLAKGIIEAHKQIFLKHQYHNVMVIQYARSAKAMEILADVLEGMDALDPDKDAWLRPIFERVYEVFGEATGEASEMNNIQKTK